MQERNFRLAPMAQSILILTLALWLLPFSFMAFSLVTGQKIAGIISLFLFALFGLVWFYCRPSSFVISDTDLRVVFPGWQRELPLKDIVRVRSMDAAAFKKQYGWAMRIGVGGLWGGFGWLWTSKSGLVEFYVSRADGLVLIERENGRDLLITPADPGAFAAGLKDRFS